LSVTAPNSTRERIHTLAQAPTAVSLDRASKTFRLPHQHYTTLKERALHPFAARTYDELKALQDVTFDVSQGEFFGIVGRNGSGKSTLLKCLAGIYRIDGGEISVDGRLSPFIELGVGFNPDLSARDNVVLNAIMLGLTRKQARDRFDEIIDFAELREFIDLPLKNYSSGMSVRLAFSVAIQVDADILLVDEVLAVGDASFQQKCFDEFYRLKDEGRTILFVTHDMGSVERFCDRAMLIERGQVVTIDEPSVIARKYNELNFGRTVHQTARDSSRHGSQAAEIESTWVEDRSGEHVVSLAQGEPCRVCFEVSFHDQLDDLVFAITLRNEARATVFTASNQWSGERSGSFRAGDRVTVSFDFENWLGPSRYTITPSLARAGGSDAIDMREDIAAMLVHATHFTGGVIDIPFRFGIERE
jgi:ABC-type polysaccharide/polyol phosphate transport system ATPase subunit